MILGTVLFGVAIGLFVWGYHTYANPESAKKRKLYALLSMLVLPLEVIHQGWVFPWIDVSVDENLLHYLVARYSIPFLLPALIGAIVYGLVPDSSQESPDHSDQQQANES